MEEKDDLQRILFAVCDQPFMKKSTLDQIFLMAAEHPEKMICAGYQGKYGNPVYFPEKYFAELLALEGDRGGSQIMKKYPDEILVCETEENQLKDIDKA